MKVLVVGGQARKVGKTAVVSGVIRGLKSLAWTAVKVTPHLHGRGADASGLAQRPFVLMEERDPYGHGDTCRFLVAGARRALLLSVEPGRLGEAVPSLREALAGAEYVIVESNRILDFLKPTLYLAVLSSARHDLKPSARRFLRQADAVVLVASDDGAREPEVISSAGFRHKPVFQVSAPHYLHRDLCAFIRRRLLRADVGPTIGTIAEIEEEAWRR